MGYPLSYSERVPDTPAASGQRAHQPHAAPDPLTSEIPGSAGPPPSAPTPYVPYGLVVAAAWSWRIAAVVLALILVVVALQAVSLVAVPLTVAVLLAVLLMPLVQFLVTRTPLNRAMAALVSVLGTILVVSGLLTLAGQQIGSGAEDLGATITEGLDEIQRWLREGPLQLTGQQLAGYLEQGRTALSENSSALTAGALNIGGTAAHFLVGIVIALIAAYFYLAQGESMWRFLVRMLPVGAREPVYQASRRGWVSLGAYARTQVLVAAVDALGIGLGALVLGLPFVVPIILLVFLASFVPIVGAIASGAVAILIALVFEGWVTALIMLAIVVAVQQLESHALQPFLMGRAVALHPLVVLSAVAIGSYLLGIVGALFAVPFVAVVNSTTRYLVGQDPFPQLGSEPMPPPRADSPGDGPGGHDEDPAAQDREDESSPVMAGDEPVLGPAGPQRD